MHCDTNSLLLGEQSSKDLPWRFQANLCSKRRLCRQPPEWTFDGVICKSYRFVIQCVCTNLKFARVPDTNASVLIIGDCGILEIDLGQNEKIVSFHIYRTEAFKIVKMPKKLKIFESFHSKITSVGVDSFSGLRMVKIETVSTKFEFISSQSFQNFQLDDFILQGTTISYMEPNAFINSTTLRLRADKSNFLHVSHFWQHFVNITLIQTFVNLPKYLLEGSRNLCMKEVIIACECLAQELGIRNNCGKMPPICSTQKYAMGCLDEEKLPNKSLLLQTSTVLVFSVVQLLNLYMRRNCS